MPDATECSQLSRNYCHKFYMLIPCFAGRVSACKVTSDRVSFAKVYRLLQRNNLGDRRVPYHRFGTPTAAGRVCFSTTSAVSCLYHFLLEYFFPSSDKNNRSQMRFYCFCQFCCFNRSVDQSTVFVLVFQSILVFQSEKVEQVQFFRIRFPPAY